MSIAPEVRICFVDVGHGRRNVLEWSLPEGPSLVLQHGRRDHARNWDLMAAALGKRYRIVAPAGIMGPTLLAYGEKSWIPVPAEQRLLRIRDHRGVTFPNASHWLHHEAREPFQRELARSLARSALNLTRKREVYA